MVSAPLYLFEQFFVGKATEHLLGEGVLAEHLNDDRLRRVLDGLYLSGLSQLFVAICMVACANLASSARVPISIRHPLRWRESIYQTRQWTLAVSVFYGGSLCGTQRPQADCQSHR
jgi:Domain of unknown function (DUF4277)